MENMGGGEQEAMELPPGFRFHPTDEELISHYLTPKAIDNNFSAVAVGEVDLNKCEPWDLPKHAKMGEKEWYFFVVKDRKYPTGMRTNRATHAGYWKATGKDKEIFRAKSLVGMKKTLVFYKGRAPKGVKSNWVMHEYRLEGPISLQNLPSTSKNEWVISRIFHKSAGGKRIPFSNLPPLMESSPTQQTKHGLAHVSCFSNPIDPSGSQNPFDGFINNHSFNSGSDPGNYFPSIFSPQTSPYHGNNYMMSEQHILRAILDKQSMKTEGVHYSASQDTCLSSDMNAEISSVVSNFYMGSRPFDHPDCDRPSTSGLPVDLDGFLNY